MTIAERKKNHRALWLWLAKTGSPNKEDWPGWEFNGGKIPKQIAHCFLCSDSCCRIIWLKTPILLRPCLHLDSPYLKWRNEPDIEKRKKLAKKIAGMWK